MISIDSLRQYSYFSQLNPQQLQWLAASSKEILVEASSFLFHSDSDLTSFYLVTEGEFEVVFEAKNIETNNDQIGEARSMKQGIVVISRVGPGEILGWSGLVSPYKATSGVRAKNRATVLAFDCKKLLSHFEEDCSFGFQMLNSAALVIGRRLQDIYKGG